MRYRLLLPEWATKQNVGPWAIEGDDFDDAYLKARNAEGYGIYYFPNYNSKPLEDHNYLRGADVDVLNYVYVDMDLKDGKHESVDSFLEKLLQFPCQPNKFLTSGNGVHAYWEVSDLDRERFISLQFRLIRHFNTDPAIWTMIRCMRREGFNNTKNPENLKFVEATVYSDKIYTFADLDGELPRLNEKEKQKMISHLRKVDGLDLEDELLAVDIDSIPDSFTALMDVNSKVNKLFTSIDGDRSKKAWELCNLLYELDFPRKEAVAVIGNTQKALSKGLGRLEYAVDCVVKCYKEKSKFIVPNALQRALQSKEGGNVRGRIIHGPSYFDCTHNKWRTQQILGLVGGSGIGKSTVTLDIFKAIIENNPDNDDICVYFNLEMTDWEVVEKWRILNNDDPKMIERLYVVSNEDDEGNARNINLQQIHWFCRDIQKSEGKRIAAVAIDHIGVINSTINITKKPDFGMAGEVEGAYGDFRNISIRRMPQLLKELAKQLDVFLVIQSQTTKAKGMDGDTALGVDAAYGAAQFEQYMDYLITIWQPLRRVQDKTDLKALGWQYVKIRSKHKNDIVAPYAPQVLNVDIETGGLLPLTEYEKAQFDTLNKEASVLRKKAEKKEEIQYTASKGLKKLKALLLAKA